MRQRLLLDLLEIEAVDVLQATAEETTQRLDEAAEVTFGLYEIAEKHGWVELATSLDEARSSLISARLHLERGVETSLAEDLLNEERRGEANLAERILRDPENRARLVNLKAAYRELLE